MSTGTAGAERGWRTVFSPATRAQVLILAFGVWLHAADSLLVATMVPVIVADIGGAPFIAWTVALYETGTIAAGVAGGLLALRYGLRRAMSVAAVAYSAGCVVSAVAPDMPVMLSGRLLQGLGGGGLMALSLVGATSLFERDLMPRVLAVISAVWGASSFLGPLIGAAFVEALSWRAGFFAFALQGVVMALLVHRILRHGVRSSGAAADQRLPVRRIGLLALAVIAVAFAGIVDDALQAGALVALGAAGVLAFLRLDTASATNRLLPLRPFDLRRPVGAALTLVFCVSAGSIALTVYGPVLVITLHGASVLEGGMFVALMSVGWTSAALATANGRESGDAVRILCGTALIIVTLGAFSFLLVSDSRFLIVALAMVHGAGFGLCWSFILRRATGHVSGEEATRLAGGLPTVQRLGFALGAAVSGLVANAAGLGDGLDAAAAERAATWLFAVGFMIALPAVPAAVRLARAGVPDAPPAAAG